MISHFRPPSPRQQTLSSRIVLLLFSINCCTVSQMQEQTHDSFNWPERPSSSDSAPDAKLEQPGSKAFYVPSSSTSTFTSKPATTAASSPSIRRHSSTGSQLRRSKHPYSPTPHEARIRNKYSGDGVKMSGHNYSQQWVKTENGECYIPSVRRQMLMFPLQKLKGNRRMILPGLVLRYDRSP